MDDKVKDTESKPHRWLERRPEMGTEPVPVSRVTDPDYYKQEQEKIFKRAWLHMGRVSEIPNKGDWFVQDIVVAGTSIIIVRGQAFMGGHTILKENYLTSRKQKITTSR